MRHDRDEVLEYFCRNGLVAFPFLVLRKAVQLYGNAVCRGGERADHHGHIPIERRVPAQVYLHIGPEQAGIRIYRAVHQSGRVFRIDY